MENSDYIKKKSANTPLLQNAIAHTPKARDSQTSTNSISQTNEKSQDTLKKSSRITSEDVSTLREIINAHNGERVSVNDFTSEDIQKAQKWAYKFYNELGTKSPFFRAWFGDWRMYDKTPIKKETSVNVIHSFKSAKEASEYFRNGLKNNTLFRGDTVNQDTNFKINVGSQVYNDTLTYANRELSRVNNTSRSEFIKQYNDEISILEEIKSICESSILLDTIVSKNDNLSDQSFVHVFYTIASLEGRKYFVKLTVDELNSMHGDIRRAYNLNAIKITPVAVSQVYKPAVTTNVSGNIVSVDSVSDLYSFVKQYDKDFHPGKNVNSALLNKNGTPKVLYHRTNNKL